MSLLESVHTGCPYCGEMIELLIDTSVSEQEYVEDCSVCCRPIVITVDVNSTAAPVVQVRREDDV